MPVGLLHNELHALWHNQSFLLHTCLVLYVTIGAGSLFHQLWLVSYWGGYLNFSARFMKNVLFEHKKIKFWNKWHYVNNETEIMEHVLKMQ
jgi:hypothetical protein